jgi:hypothetical protein
LKLKHPNFLLICLCLILSCNLPTAAPAEATPTASPTVTASLTPTQTRMPFPTATASLTPTSIPTLDITGPATAIANAEVHCWAGPTNEYPLVIQLNAGESVAVVGKASTHWIVKPAAAEECWVDALLVTVSGATAYLPDFALPPIPVTGPPTVPVNLTRVSGTCTPVSAKAASSYVIKYKIEYLLTWADTSNNEDGFYVYRDFKRVAEVPANTTQLIDTFIIRSGGSIFYYYVVAYNSAGQTQGETLWLATPCR